MEQKIHGSSSSRGITGDNSGVGNVADSDDATDHNNKDRIPLLVETLKTETFSAQRKKTAAATAIEKESNTGLLTCLQSLSIAMNESGSESISSNMGEKKPQMHYKSKNQNDQNKKALSNQWLADSEDERQESDRKTGSKRKEEYPSLFSVHLRSIMQSLYTLFTRVLIGTQYTANTTTTATSNTMDNNNVTAATVLINNKNHTELYPCSLQLLASVAAYDPGETASSCMCIYILRAVNIPYFQTCF